MNAEQRAQPSDHPGWVDALAGIETDDSRAFATTRAKDMSRESLHTITTDPTISATVPAWKREIYAAELRRRPLDWPEQDGRAVA